MSDPADLRSAVVAAAARLSAAGVVSSRHDAEALAAHVLGTTRSRLLLVDALGDRREEFEALVDRRAAREPLQHLTGEAAFRHLVLAVGPGVFVPRPETETLVDLALAAVRGTASPLVVDLGTGSGAVALSIAAEHPGARVHAVEADPAAADWAARNIAALRLPVTLHRTTMADGLADLGGAVDLVVSNPPYVPTDEQAALEPEVADHDPALALWGGPDGLDGPREVARAAQRLLIAGGAVVCEHSDRHGESVPALFVAAGFSAVTLHLDLTGRPRFTSARLAR